MKFYTSFDKQLPKHETKQSGGDFPNFGVSEQPSVSNHPADWCRSMTISTLVSAPVVAPWFSQVFPAWMNNSSGSGGSGYRGLCWGLILFPADFVQRFWLSNEAEHNGRNIRSQIGRMLKMSAFFWAIE